MPTSARLSAALLLSAAITLPACQMFETSTPKPPRKMDERLPPKVATREAAKSGSTSLSLSSAQGSP